MRFEATPRRPIDSAIDAKSVLWTSITNVTCALADQLIDDAEPIINPLVYW